VQFNAHMWWQKQTRVCEPHINKPIRIEPIHKGEKWDVKDMSNKKWAAAIKKAQQKLTKEKRDLASTHIGQLMQQVQDRECMMAPYNFE
jgi:hypothetical protein